MIALFNFILRTLWPFLKEVFFKNGEVKEALKDKHFVTKAILIIAVAVFVLGSTMHAVSTLLYETHDRYRSITGDYNRLQREYETLIVERRDLSRELMFTRNSLEDTEVRNEFLLDKVEKLRVSEQKVAREKEDLETVVTTVLNKCDEVDSDIIQNDRLYRRSNINDLLEGL